MLIFAGCWFENMLESHRL